MQSCGYLFTWNSQTNYPQAFGGFECILPSESKPKNVGIKGGEILVLYLLSQFLFHGPRTHKNL